MKWHHDRAPTWEPLMIDKEKSKRSSSIRLGMVFHCTFPSTVIVRNFFGRTLIISANIASRFSAISRSLSLSPIPSVIVRISEYAAYWIIITEFRIQCTFVTLNIVITRSAYSSRLISLFFVYRYLINTLVMSDL